MGEKIVIGPINHGLRNDRTAFVIDNDSFPTLINAYQWRGRIKRKRGTSLLGRLKRFFNSTSTSYNSGSATITLDGSGNGNILTGFSLQTNGNIVPGSVTIFDTVSSITYTDPLLNGSLSPSGSINYATGAITIAAAAGHTVNAIFNYYPDLPVMGLRELILSGQQFPGTLAFDTTYSYNIQTAFPYGIYDVSFYKNPPTGTYVGYTQKTTVTPTSWNGQDYQQFWTTNYQGALWATNGITVPFTTTNIGMQFKPIITVDNITSGPPAFADLTITGHGLVVGDFVFVNEVVTTTGINFQTGYVVTVVDANKVTVEFPNATITTDGTGGIAQYLTNRSDITKDCIRWYDGDPTNGSATTPVLSGNLGWVNFCPPLSEGIFSIADRPAKQWYLVGARMILPFKDRLLFFGPVIQSSSGNDQTYLQDTVIYSQNGTPYYTASYTNTPSATVDTPTSATNVFFPILVPVNQTATSPAYFEDQTGFGGFISAGVDQAINTAAANEDVIIVGFDRLQTRFVYTGNDIVPFLFYIINSELGSGSTFSSIILDQGILTKGTRGYVITSQVGTQRIDLEIPDQVFQVNLTSNGTERVCSQRDYINEWVYFTYPSNQVSYKFPNQTLQFNYRDNSWAILNESYTTYGSFRRQSGFIWSTVGTVYPTWRSWNEPWDAGTSTLFQPEVIAGNQQGFVLFRDEGTNEGNSVYIRSISGNIITSPNHNLNRGDFIIISGVLGTLSTQLNDEIFQVGITTTTTFTLNPSITSGTYLGGGVIKRMYVPFIQTKQFPVAWQMARKTRLGPQQYLLTTTEDAKIQLLIFLSQNSTSAYNTGSIVPTNIPPPINNSLIYGTTLFTCPESTNLGLTPANTNLQTPTARQQAQLWHRINTSLIGDTVQIGFTMSEDQMRELDKSVSFAITGVTQTNPCVLTCVGQFGEGQLITISGVVGMTQLNGQTYDVISSTPTTVTVDVDSTAFSPYISGGIATLLYLPNQFSEIELHSIILDVNPSQLLV